MGQTQQATGGRATEHTAGSVFLRIATRRTSKDRVAIVLLEVDREGYIPREVGIIPREVGIADDGTPVYVTRPGEYGRWNDSDLPRIPPGRSEFDELWRPLGTEITAREFEAAYGPAAATLPETIGGTPLWVSSLAWWIVILGSLVFLAAILVVIVRPFG